MVADPSEHDDLSPAERRRKRVRESIVEAAEAIFNEEGEAAISMRRIAERIDYSPAALYKYFDSKEALFDEIREQFFERLLRRMQEVTATVTEGPQVNAACLKAYVETGLEQPGHYKMAFTGWFSEEIDKQDTYAFAASEHLERMIREGIEEGWFEPVDTHLAAHSVWAAAHGLAMLFVTVPDFPAGKPDCAHLTQDQQIEFHARMIGRGLGTAKLIAFIDAQDKK